MELDSSQMVYLVETQVEASHGEEETGDMTSTRMFGIGQSSTNRHRLEKVSDRFKYLRKEPPVAVCRSFQKKS